MKRYHVVLSGNVQGVAFRSFTVAHAVDLKIKGFVRNTGDDKVEIVAECEPEQFKKFMEKIKVGPRFAKVYDFVVKEESPTGEFTSFEQN
jgi:acylphosphatase